VRTTNQPDRESPGNPVTRSRGTCTPSPQPRRGFWLDEMPPQAGPIADEAADPVPGDVASVVEYVGLDNDGWIPLDQMVDRIGHHPDCLRDPFFVRMRESDPPLPPAVMHECRACGARLILDGAAQLDDPERVELEARWRVRELEAQLAHAHQAAAVVARVRDLSRREVELGAAIGAAEAGAAGPLADAERPGRRGHPPLDPEWVSARYHDAAVSIREAGSVPTYELMARELDRTAKTVDRWRRRVRLPVPASAGKPPRP
jgi:hypothetical protein